MNFLKSDFKLQASFDLIWDVLLSRWNCSISSILL